MTNTAKFIKQIENHLHSYFYSESEKSLASTYLLEDAVEVIKDLAKDLEEARDAAEDIRGHLDTECLWVFDWDR